MLTPDFDTAVSFWPHMNPISCTVYLWNSSCVYSEVTEVMNRYYMAQGHIKILFILKLKSLLGLLRCSSWTCIIVIIAYTMCHWITQMVDFLHCRCLTSCCLESCRPYNNIILCYYYMFNHSVLPRQTATDLKMGDGGIEKSHSCKLG